MRSQFSTFCARLREFISNASAERAFQRCANDEFNSLALELFELQFAHNAPYRRFCEARGIVPRNVTDWWQIPAVPASSFKDVELSCLSLSERATVFYSSGTTEQRASRHFHNAESLAIYEASLWPWFARHVLPDLKSQIPDFKLAILTPPKNLAPHSSLVHMFGTIAHKLGANESAFVGTLGEDGAWTLDYNAALEILQKTVSSRTPLLLLGTAFSFVHLLDFLAEQQLSFELPSGSRVMETGGYKGRSRNVAKAELHALIHDRLGIPRSHIVCEYGMSELSSQAYDRDLKNEDEGRERGRGGAGPSRITHYASSAFHFPPWARAQIVSPETACEVADGETGLVRVFDLANVFSVMAVQTEDLAIRREEAFELIGRAALAERRGCSLMAS